EWPEEYFDELTWFSDWPTGLRVRVIALDPSKGKDARRGDYSAYVVLGIGAEHEMYVEADLARRATPQMIADGVELARQFRPHAFGVESNQFQELLGAQLVAELDRLQMPHMRPWLVTNDDNKLVRIR